MTVANFAKGYLFRIMKMYKFIVLFSFLLVGCIAEDTNLLLDNLFEEIKTALNAEGGQTRQHQYPYRPQNNGISLNIYEALRSIAKNDELGCVSRLLCEAAAGGKPGFSGKQIKFDKDSLTKLISYLQLDIGSSSPLLVFGKAALLGVSNRGDPYSCIINYPKCPKDESRLLYYLNNHRGGFFQYFDKKYHKPGNYYYQNQYRPGYYYQKYQKEVKRNKIQFEKPEALYEKFRKKANSDLQYAKKYSYTLLTFPEGDRKRITPMVFPKTGNSGVDPRILTQPSRPTDNDLFFSTNRYPKQNSKFFPQGNEPTILPAALPTDRLPSRFYFPENDGTFTYSSVKYSPNSFFPNT